MQTTVENFLLCYEKADNAPLGTRLSNLPMFELGSMKTDRTYTERAVTEVKTEKVVRDGKVAVLVSPRFGAGWHSWNTGTEGSALLFDPELVAAVEAKNIHRIARRASEIDPKTYLGGSDDLEIEWVPVGVKFKVIEFDGNETLIRSDDDDWITA